MAVCYVLCACKFGPKKLHNENSGRRNSRRRTQKWDIQVRGSLRFITDASARPMSQCCSDCNTLYILFDVILATLNTCINPALNSKNVLGIYVISDFRRDVNEAFVHPQRYAALIGSQLPTFRDITVPKRR